MTWIGLDPGVRVLGYAIAAHAGAAAVGLRVCGIAQAHDPDLGSRAWTMARSIENAYAADFPGVFLESMTASSGRTTTAQDLIDVQTVGCLVAAQLSGYVRLLTPAEWKGSTPKAIHHERMVKALDSRERALLRIALEQTPAKHHKEVLDAVGILMYGIGRIERTGAARKAGA